MAANVIYSPGTSPSSVSPLNSVSYGPPISDYNNNFDYHEINKRYDDFSNAFNSSGSSARDYVDSISDFMNPFIRYNDVMFSKAKEYDEYMSNTAIQRQVKDLIAAGLNPVLAAHLGGATYKGVSVPYISINPASGLSAMTGLTGSIYSADSSRFTNLETTKMTTSSSQLIASYNKTMERLINNDTIGAQKEMIQLKGAVDKYLQDCKHLNDVQLQELGFKNQKSLMDYEKQLEKNYWNWRNYGHEDGLSGEADFNAENFFEVFFRMFDGITRLIPGAKGFLRD